MATKLIVEWKARDKITSHAWIFDKEKKDEIPVCDSQRKMPYLKPSDRFKGTKKCKKCIAVCEAIKKEKSNVEIRYE